MEATNMQNTQIIPTLINDVLELVIKLTPISFLGVDKYLQQKITTGIIKGQYKISQVSIPGLEKATSCLSDALFTKLLDIACIGVPTLYEFTKYTLSQGLYTKAECVGKIMAGRSYISGRLVVGTRADMLKYYELYGIDNLIISHDRIIAGNWMVVIMPENFLPIIPESLLPELFARYHDISDITHGNYMLRSLFMESSPERIYNVFKNYNCIHHKLILQMIRDGGREYVRKLLDKGVQPSDNDRFSHYVESYIYDNTPNYDDEILCRLRAHMSVVYPTIAKDILSNYLTACEAWNIYITAHISGNSQEQISNLITNLELLHAIVMDEYEVWDNIKMIIKWCLKANDKLLLDKLIVLNPVIDMYIGDSVGPVINDVEQLLDVLSALQIDINLNKYSKLRKAIVVIIHGMCKDINQLIVNRGNQLHENTNRFIQDTIFYMMCVREYRGDDFDAFMDSFGMTLQGNILGAKDQEFLFNTTKHKYNIRYKYSEYVFGDA